MSRNPLPAMLAPESIVVTVDTREQTPLDLAPLSIERGTLDTGDYALASCPDVCRVERKSLADLVACVGADRDRFEREVSRLLAYPVRVLVVESTWETIESHELVMPQWRGKVTKESVIGSLLGWQAAGLSIHMAGDHERAGRHIARLLYMVAKRRYRELRSLVKPINNNRIGSCDSVQFGCDG
jgi:ERCC4-type nuclease